MHIHLRGRAVRKSAAAKIDLAKWLPNARLVMILALVLFAGLCAVCDNANAGTINLVTNGSFETTTLGTGVNGSYICGTSGTTCVSVIPGWSSTCNGTCDTSATVDSLLVGGTNGVAFNGGIGLWNTTNGGTSTIANSPDGGNFVAIDGDSTYGKPISQTINGLVIGTSYTLSFYQAAAQQKGSGNGNPTTERWSVTLGSSPAQLSTQMTNPDKGFTAWSQQTMTFTATQTSELLTFAAAGTPSGVPPISLLDGVSLSANAPEPQTYGLVGLALVMFPALHRLRRRKKQQS